VVELSDTELAGPIGLCPLDGAKMEISSPGETEPVAPLAAFVTPEITGRGAETVRLTLTIVVPVAGLVPWIVIVPV
jgi:hypothetical protein